MKPNIKEIELIVNDEDMDYLSAMGLVGEPAIEKGLVYFGDDRTNYTFGKEVEEGIIVSPALIAEKRIFRYNPETNEEFYVWFSAETIKKLSQNFLMTDNFKQTTEQHEKPVEGVHMIYSWIVMNQQDPIITHYGYKDIPNGSWVVSYKIENDDIKKKIKSGEIAGLSIEAFLSEKYSKNLSTDEIKIQQIKDLLDTV